MKTRRLTSRTHRIICSRYPTIGVFDDITRDEDELRVAFELEALTNGRLQATRRLQQIPNGAVAAGPGASLVMAAFLHCSESGGRFNDHRLGCWYAATEIETAIEETVFHNERRLRASADGFPNRLQMRELIAAVDVDALDLRRLAGAHPELYDPLDYGRSQAFATARRWPFVADGIKALMYDSVRRVGGTNACIFHPLCVPLPVVQGDHYEYVWDAHGKLAVLKLTPVVRVA